MGLFSKKKKDEVKDKPENVKDFKFNDNGSINLICHESHARDVGRGVARIDSEYMDAINVTPGDVVEIRGKGRTVVTCLPLRSSNEEKEIIKIDEIDRKNLAITIGDIVSVRKTSAIDAQKVIVATLQNIPDIDERYLTDALDNVPLIKGDNVMIPYFGGRLTFQVVEFEPSVDVVRITSKTICKILHSREEMNVENISWDTGVYEKNPENHESEEIFYDDISSESKSKNDKSEEVILKVSEAYSNDIGHNIARIDYESMGELDLHNGDIIEIQGKRITVSRCIPIDFSDRGKRIIRIDGITRNNAGLKIDDFIKIKKIFVSVAKEITIRPLQHDEELQQKIPNIDGTFLSKNLTKYPIIHGDNLSIIFQNDRFLFRVIETYPTNLPVLINEDTIFHIVDYLELSKKAFVESNNESELKILNSNDDVESKKTCALCGENLIWPDIHSCYYCQKNYCSEHRLAENHECPKVMAAKHIEKDYLRKKGVNITSAKFAVICKSCGYESEYAEIEKVNKIRIDHIKQNHCKSETVKLRQHEDNKIEDDQFIQKTYPTDQGNTWMYGCLEDAKQVILNHHNAEGIAEFFAEANFSISIQTDMENAYGYINGSFPHYGIGIHQALEENSPESFKMVTVVLIHEILHALHGDWSESQVSNEEKRLANLGLHFDALHNLDLLYLSGKMRLCGK